MRDIYDTDRVCAQCQDRWPAKGDPFCSRKCAELASGVLSAAEAHRRSKVARKIRSDEREPSIEVENLHVNRERTAGPHIARKTSI